jgi:hypothetical protein
MSHLIRPLPFAAGLTGLLSLVIALGAAAPARAAEVKPWTAQYESSLEATTNLQQQAHGTPDVMWRNSLELSYYPATDADNSALFRLQALNSRYWFNPDYNSTYLIANALTSRRLFDSVYGYGGYQAILKQADAVSGTTQRDNDFFAGAVVYTPLGASRLIFHGYQFDYLRAGVNEASYQGHSLYVTLRDLTTDRWVNSLSLRSQVRDFDTISELEWRNFASFESVYHLTSWWSVEGDVIYLTSLASRRDYSFSGFNFGLFSRFSY